METLKSLFVSVSSAIPNLQITDIIDILIVAFLIYQLVGLIRSTNAFRVVKGIVLILVCTLLTDVFHLDTLHFLLSRVLELGVVAVVIVFQPELRRALERVGSQSFSSLFSTRNPHSEVEDAISAVVDACEIMSRDHIGALIVFERSTQLGDYFKTGTLLDASPSAQLLRSIFFPNTALHDGAVILRKGRIAAAGCVLPLTENTHLSSDLGTRHRAGIGISEVSDAVVVIVSEETGTVSVAVGGMLKRHLAPQMLARLLTNELVTAEEEEKKTLLVRLRDTLLSGGGKNEGR